MDDVLACCQQWYLSGNMPMTGKAVFDEEKRASWFSHQAETSTPYYYKVYLGDYNTTAELAPTSHAAVFRFTFAKGDSAFIATDAFDKGSWIKIIPSERKIIGYTTRNSGGVPDNFKNYFVLTFDKPFYYTATVADGKTQSEQLEAKGDHAMGTGGGNLASPTSSLVTLKHFLAYGIPQGGQNGNPSVVGRRDLLQNFLPPFETAINAGALSVMTSYNSVDGVPWEINPLHLAQQPTIVPKLLIVRKQEGVQTPVIYINHPRYKCCSEGDFLKRSFTVHFIFATQER